MRYKVTYTLTKDGETTTDIKRYTVSGPNDLKFLVSKYLEDATKQGYKAEAEFEEE